MKLKGLLLGGGLGTRLRPLTYTGNKHTLPIANKPMILYALENLVNAGINDIIVIIGPLKEGIVEIIDNEIKNNEKYNSVKVNYVEQKDPLGIAHAIMVAEKLLGDDYFVVNLGDNLFQYGIKKFVDTLIEKKPDVVIGVTEVKDPRPYGVLVMKDGKPVKLVEKPKEPISNLAVVGVYAFSPEVHKYTKKLKPSWRGEYEITDLIQLMLDDGKRVEVVKVEGWWKDTGKTDDLLEANQLILDSTIRLSINTDKIHESAKIEGRVFIDKGTIIKENVRIRGPAIIGKNCVIGPNVYIGPYTSIGDECVLANVDIENSIVMRNTTIENISQRISDSIIGNYCTISNSSGKPSSIRIIVGDRSQIKL
ncbi:MAG: glucose-1-phosphate thymidylyltransferase [Saccharolobus sp.]